jgi:O-antigen ligase
MPSSDPGLSRSHQVARGKSFDWYHELPFVLIFGILAVSPFPFGSVSPVVIALLSIVAGSAIAAMAFRMPSVPSAGVLTVAVLVLVAVYAATAYLQLVPRLPGDPMAHPIWREAQDLLGFPLSASASIARNQPIFAVGAPLLVLLMFIGGYCCGAEDIRARRLLRVLAWVGGVYAILGIVLFVIEPRMVLWREKIAYLSSLTGPFTNRNTAAVYFGSSATIWMILFFGKAIASGRSRRSGKQRSSARSILKLRRAIPEAVFFFICVIAVLLTGSRAGAGSVAVGLVLTFILCLKRVLSRRIRKWLILGGGVFVVLMIYQIASSGIGERLQTEGFAGGGRAEGVRSIIAMISAAPWIGTGLGTFTYGFASYRSALASGWGVWDKAHNVLLEIAAEGGLLLAAVVLLAWVVAIILLVRALRRAEKSSDSIVAALGVCTIALLHSLIDFSLQIPAYGITVSSLMGAGLAQALKSPGPKSVNLQSIQPPA